MTLQEALVSGKKFARPTTVESEGFLDAEEFLSGITTEDILAADYLLEPEELSVAILAAAFNQAKTITMPSAGDSKVFAKMVTYLKAQGLIVG